MDVLLTALLVFTVAASLAEQPPNIVVLFADDFGYGDMASYGHPTQEWNALDDLASEGLRFTQWYSGESLCTPSRAALLTGRLPVRSGMIPGGEKENRVLGPTSKNGLPQDEITIAELLKTKGYATGHVGKWHLGINAKTATDGAHLPAHHGFDYVGTSLPFSNVWGCDDRGVHEKQPDNKVCFAYHNTTIFQQPINHTELTPSLVRDAVGFIHDHRTDPFFLYFAFAHCHVSMFSSPGFTGKSARGVYGDNFAEMAWAAGEVISTLKSLDLANNTLVFFTSDNGPHIELCLEGGSASLLQGGKSMTYEGGIRMPAIAWWPGKIQPGRVTSQIASTMDIFVTAAKIAGVDLPTNVTIDGRDISPILFDVDAKTPHDFLFHYCSSRLMAVRHGPYKAHYYTQMLPLANYTTVHCTNGSPHGEFFQGWDCYGPTVTEHNPPLLFNVEADASETYALNATEYGDVLAKIAAAVTAHKAALKPRPPLLGVNDAHLQPCCNPPHCACE